MIASSIRIVPDHGAAFVDVALDAYSLARRLDHPVSFKFEKQFYKISDDASYTAALEQYKEANCSASDLYEKIKNRATSSRAMPPKGPF